MAFLVEQQDEPLATIETTAVDVEKNAEEGYAHSFPFTQFPILIRPSV
jgi:t-SNARE complex subunit (syntaxin)